MSLLTPVQMIWSSQQGWNALSRTHPSIGATFAKIVLPPSLFAAAMVLYAARWHGAVYAADVPFTRWLYVASVFLLLSWLCVHVMAAFIRLAVHADARPAYADCYRLAAIAPVPIWLSAVGLFVPNPLLNVAVALAGLLAAGGLIYHGLDALFEHDDSVQTLSLAYTVFSMGALVWALLGALLVLPML